MPFPRFRLRTLMIAVAVVGLTLGGFVGLLQMDQRRQRLRALAGDHLKRSLVSHLNSEVSVAHRAARADIERYRILAEYNRALNLKYQRAASRPWLPVPPDPPEPK